jgi:hypothetical protein
VVAFLALFELSSLPSKAVRRVLQQPRSITECKKASALIQITVLVNHPPNMQDPAQPSLWKAAIPTLLFYAGYVVAMASLVMLSKYGFGTSQQAMAMLILLPVFIVVLLVKNLVQLFVLHQPQLVAVCLHLAACLLMLVLV